VVNGQAFTPTQTQTYVVTAPNANGCLSTDVIQVTVRLLPSVNAGPDVVVCEGETVLFNASGAGANGVYVWSNGVGNGTSVFIAESGIFTVVGTDDLGCTNSDSFSVTVSPSPTVDFSPSVLFGTPPLTVNFTNNSQNANVFFWNFGTGAISQTVDLSSASVVYTAPGIYLVTVTASNGSCQSIADTTITVFPFGDPEIVVPNVFTPNGSAPNDLWAMTLVNVSRLELEIFNRWGNPIQTLTEQQPYWDGTTTGGKSVTDGVYFYRYKLMGVNGNSLEGHGFVTVLR
jgi:gliding motility-associated-like protein